MFRNLFFAAVLAALCAGLVTSAIQHFRVTPLILAAEAFEDGAGDAHAHAHAHAHAEGEAVASHSHDADEWMPQDGLERSVYTVLANVLTAAGYALIIGAVSLLFNIPLTTGTGLLWGLGGFATFALAPALGLPPGLPGMPVADTLARQIWWAGAVVCTGAAILLYAKSRASWALTVGAVLIALPHLVGAPQPPTEPSGIPAALAASFVATMLFNAAVFWLVLGTVQGRLHQHFARQSTQSAGAIP